MLHTGISLAQALLMIRYTLLHDKWTNNTAYEPRLQIQRDIKLKLSTRCVKFRLFSDGKYENIGNVVVRIYEGNWSVSGPIYRPSLEHLVTNTVKKTINPKYLTPVPMFPGSAVLLLDPGDEVPHTAVVAVKAVEHLVEIEERM
ncbi:hypothetical protein BGZ80_008024 [Entomortierella chlamydospora]|uniref:Uncharacterized protein n=1 Tax=Entomortierella chlamydospora TaxID=101097 RepID=A0A9P6MYP1_9FUNG|nr:hypothetical protein BGZ80_008024 [Entomortierella chlamydospora]